MSIELVIFLGLVNWIATIIITESVIFEDVRSVVTSRADCIGRRHPSIGRKLRYFVTCALCMGTWVGFIQAICFGGPLEFGYLSFVANGLLYKAIGHLFLQINAWFHVTIQNKQERTPSNV